MRVSMYQSDRRISNKKKKVYFLCLPTVNSITDNKHFLLLFIYFP